MEQASIPAVIKYAATILCSVCEKTEPSSFLESELFSKVFLSILEERNWDSLYNEPSMIMECFKKNFQNQSFPLKDLKEGPFHGGPPLPNLIGLGKGF